MCILFQMERDDATEATQARVFAWLKDFDNNEDIQKLYDSSDGLKKNFRWLLEKNNCLTFWDSWGIPSLLCQGDGHGNIIKTLNKLREKEFNDVEGKEFLSVLQTVVRLSHIDVRGLESDSDTSDSSNSSGMPLNPRQPSPPSIPPSRASPLSDDEGHQASGDE